MGVLLILIGFIISLLITLTAANKTTTCLGYLSEVRSSRHGRFENNICKGEIYTLGHQFKKFWNECSIEPADEFLSYRDSVWTFYKCIVEKSLVDKRLTLANYAEMMTGNMSETTKSAILLVLNKNSSETNFSDVWEETEETSNSSKHPELEEIRYYWNTYFDAEMSVCLDTPNNTCRKSNSTRKSRFYTTRLRWAPAEECVEGTVPTYRRRKIDFPSWNETIKCLQSLTKEVNYTFVNNSADIPFGDQLKLCDEIAAGKFELEDVDKLLDFETVYYKDFIPEFYSQYVKRYVFNATRKAFAKTYYNYNETILASESVKDVVSYAAQHLEMKWKDQGKREEIWPLLTNAAIITFFKYDFKWSVDPCFLRSKYSSKTK